MAVRYVCFFLLVCVVSLTCTIVPLDDSPQNVTVKAVPACERFLCIVTCSYEMFTVAHQNNFMACSHSTFAFSSTLVFELNI